MDFLDDLNQVWENTIAFWDSLPSPVHFLFSIIGYIILLLLTLRITRVFINRYREKLTPTTYHSLKTLSRMVIILLFAVAFLNQFEQFQGSLIGFSALLGTAIGFASTQTVGNMISGLYLMISRPFYIADYVLFPKLGIEGIIKEITINYTKVIIPNGTTAIISNRTVLNSEVINTRYELEESEVSKDKKIEEHDSLDIDKVGIEIKNLFKKIVIKKQIVYIYPIKFSVSVGMKQNDVNQALKKLEQYLENEVPKVKDMSWKVISRNRLEIIYEISVIVEDPYVIFRIVNTALNKIEIFLENIEENL
ncbi:MAG: mechanosensitive ion channel domain-containing protein [Candidatus Hodarchaeales archaeon]|jgi:small-conductance mechanosensitive channel